MSTGRTPLAGAAGGPRSSVRELVGAAAFGVFALGVALFFAAPSFRDFDPAWMALNRAGDYLKLCADPLARDLREPMLAYRIVPPLIAHLAGGGMVVSLLLPYAATAGMLSLVFVAVRRRTDGELARWTTLLVASTGGVSWPNCMPGYGDPFAYLGIAALLVVRGRVLVALVSAAAVLSDERAVLAFPLVWLWQRDAAPGISGRWTSGVAVGLLFALLVRMALARGWIGPGVESVKLYGDMTRMLFSGRPWVESWGVWWVNLFSSLRWGWWIPAAAVWALRRAARPRAAAFLGSQILLVVFLSVATYDVTRSVSFLLPGLVLGVTYLSDRPTGWLRPALRASAWLCFLTPAYWIASGSLFWWWRPLPLRVAAYVTGSDPLSWW